jgi:hypothetical protein
MITAHSTQLPDIQGLILLDCWEPSVCEHFFKDKFYVNLIENITKNHGRFNYIINSVGQLQVDLHNPVMANTMKVCGYNDNHPIMQSFLKQPGVEKTSTLISRYLLHAESPSINILNAKDFVWFCTKYLPGHIQNWLVAGQTWQLCTHEHGLGLNALAEVTKKYPLNFYATDYSFCTMTEQTATLPDFEQDSLNWCKIENFGYQLQPQH